MGEAIRGRTATVEAATAQGPTGLRLVPIVGGSHDEPSYRVLDEQTLEHVRIGEVSEAGNVPTLRVANPLDDRLLLIDGQELVGAKQNRILNADVLVPAGTTLDVPVSCVEQGRWRYEQRHFKPGRSASYATRRGKSRRVHESLKRSGAHDADQSAVWQEVETELTEAGTSSASMALSDVYTARQQDLDVLRRSLTLPANAVGLAVFHGEAFQGMDLFNRHGTLVYFWQSLIDSYALGWLNGAEQDTSAQAKDAQPDLNAVLEQIGTAAWQPYGSPGEGVDYRLEHEAYTGSALVWEERTALHITVFPQDEQSEQKRETAAETAPRRPRMHRRYLRGGGAH